MKTKLLILAVIFMIAACKSSSDKTETSASSNALNGTISISGAYALSPLMKIWAEKFMVLHPGLKIEVLENGTGAGLDNLLAGKSQIAMISSPLTPSLENKGLWKVDVSREGIVPVVNSNNPELSSLLIKGITRETLGKVYSGNHAFSWESITGKAGNSSINTYCRADRSGAAEFWARYLDLSTDKLNGVKVNGDTGIISAVKLDKLALGFCNAHYAFNLQSHSAAEGITVLPIDFNGNGKIDSKEDIYESIEKLHRAAYLGTFPSHLCRDLSLVCLNKPTDANITEFIRWILAEGQEIAIQSGYCEIRYCDKDKVLEDL
ncbi:MAG: substrate-binding domain-containing protein [Bacteroidales bacterium]|nr:substrate-binding domain-containing protein [Bacteroidales bacterium]